MRQVGGRLTINAYPESVAVSLVVPSARASDAVRAMTRSYFAPVLTDIGSTLARRNVLEDGAIRSFDQGAAITDAIYAALFASGPAKIPPYGTSSSYASVPIDAVRAFAERAFRPANALLIVTGAVDASIISAALPGREGALPNAETPAPETLAGVRGPVQARGAEPGFGLGWAGPPISSEREATAFDFIADYLFYPDTGVVQKAVRNAGTSLVGTFVTYHDPGVFLLTASGGDQAAARAAVDAALLAIRRPLDAAAFAAARHQFIYHILSDDETPVGARRHLRLVRGRGQSGLRSGRGRYGRTLSGLRRRVDAGVRRGDGRQIPRSSGRGDHHPATRRECAMILPLLLAATLALTAVPHEVDLGSAKLYAQNDAGAQLVGVEFIVSAGTARQTVAQSGLAALTAQALLFTKIDGTRLSDRIAAAGGSVDYAVAPGIARFSLEVLASSLGPVSADFARALSAPDTSAATIAAAREAVGARIDAEERNPVTVGVEMLHTAYYTGTAGAPAYGTRPSLAQLGPADVSGVLRRSLPARQHVRDRDRPRRRLRRRRDRHRDRRLTER